MGQKSKSGGRTVRGPPESGRREGPLLSWRANPPLAGSGTGAKFPRHAWTSWPDLTAMTDLT